MKKKEKELLEKAIELAGEEKSLTVRLLKSLFTPDMIEENPDFEEEFTKALKKKGISVDVHEKKQANLDEIEEPDSEELKKLEEELKFENFFTDAQDLQDDDVDDDKVKDEDDLEISNSDVFSSMYFFNFIYYFVYCSSVKLTSYFETDFHPFQTIDLQS